MASFSGIYLISETIFDLIEELTINSIFLILSSDKGSLDV